MRYADYGRDKNEPSKEKGGRHTVPSESQQQDYAFQCFAFGENVSSAQDEAVSLFLKPNRRRRRATFAQLQRLKDGYQSLLERHLLPLVDDLRSGSHLRRYSLEILAACRQRGEFYELLVTIRDEQHRFLWPAFSGREYPSYFPPKDFCGLIIEVRDPEKGGEVLRIKPLLSPDLREKELARFESGDMEGVFGDCTLRLIRRRSRPDTDVTKIEKALGRSAIQSAFLVTDTLGKVHLVSPISDPEALEKDLHFGSTLFNPLVPLPNAEGAEPQFSSPIPAGAQIVSEFTQNQLKRGYKLVSSEDSHPSMETLASRIPPLLMRYFGDSWQRDWHIGLEVMLRRPKGDHTLAVVHVMDHEGEYRLPNKSGARGVKYPLFTGIIIEREAQGEPGVSGVCIPRPLLEAQLYCMAQEPAESVLCVPLETAILRSMRQQGLDPEAVSLSSVISSVGPSTTLRAGPSSSGLYSLLSAHNHGKHLAALHYHEASGALFFDCNLKVGMYFPAGSARPRAK